MLTQDIIIFGWVKLYSAQRRKASKESPNGLQGSWHIFLKILQSMTIVFNFNLSTVGYKIPSQWIYN